MSMRNSREAIDAVNHLGEHGLGLGLRLPITTVGLYHGAMGFLIAAVVLIRPDLGVLMKACEQLDGLR